MWGPRGVISALWVGATVCMAAGLILNDDQVRDAAFFLALAGMTAVIAYTLRWATGIFVTTLALFVEDVELRELDDDRVRHFVTIWRAQHPAGPKA